MLRSIITHREICCTSPREAVWNALADTHQLNRAIGNHPLESEPIQQGAERYRVKTRLAGLSLEYEEQPFEWKQPEFLSIERRFLNGPARRYKIEWRLVGNQQGGCCVQQCLEIEPRAFWFWPFVYLNSVQISRRLVCEIRHLDANLSQGLEAYADAKKSPIDSAALERATQTLYASLPSNERDLAERLAQHVAFASDVAVSRMRPFELADRWGVDRRRIVAISLQGVLSGLLELSWEIICPSCRTLASRVETLSQLEEQAHCHLCDITIQVDFDRAVEATFRPAEAIRPLEDRPYCIGGPFRTPHVVRQALLPADGTATILVPDAEGRYRLFIRGGATVSIEITAQGSVREEVAAGEQASPAELTLAPQGELLVHDRLNQKRHLKLEHLAWASVATTAHYVSTFDTFRRLFSAEVLRPGLRVKTSRVVLLFTDLTGSTALYTQHGDAKAYCFVLEHFALLEAIIDEHEGAVVKTLGDAVMAAFTQERAALNAAIAMQRAYARFAQDRDEAHGVQMCMGLYSGPAYLVNANHILDYFGQTVNIANRLQGASDGGQIVLPAEMAERLEASGGLKGVRQIGQFEAQLKGLDLPIAAVRLKADIE
jgi:adenylate cyclase